VSGPATPLKRIPELAILPGGIGGSCSRLAEPGKCVLPVSSGAAAAGGLKNRPDGGIVEASRAGFTPPRAAGRNAILFGYQSPGVPVRFGEERCSTRPTPTENRRGPLIIQNGHAQIVEARRPAAASSLLEVPTRGRGCLARVEGGEKPSELGPQNDLLATRRAGLNPAFELDVDRTPSRRGRFSNFFASRRRERSEIAAGRLKALVGGARH